MRSRSHRIRPCGTLASVVRTWSAWSPAASASISTASGTNSPGTRSGRDRCARDHTGSGHVALWLRWSGHGAPGRRPRAHLSRPLLERTLLGPEAVEIDALEITQDPAMWHFGFGGQDMERLVAGRERIYLDRFWNELSWDQKRSR